MGIYIRDAKIEDYEALARINRDGWLDNYPSKDHGIAREDIAEHLQMKDKDVRFKERIPKFPHVVLVNGDKVVGYADSDGRSAAIYIDKSCAGKGWGRKLATSLFNKLDKGTVLTVDIVKYNIGSRKFFESLEFKLLDETGVYRLRGSAKELPLVKMRKTL